MINHVNLFFNNVPIFHCRSFKNENKKKSCKSFRMTRTILVKQIWFKKKKKKTILLTRRNKFSSFGQQVENQLKRPENTKWLIRKSNLC